MSEYWKSTPKYWCKFCQIYVRDTTLEKKQHEATGKHQGNIQRSLRDLHKNQSKDDREKQRAKDEVARITGAVSGKPSTKAGPAQPLMVAKSKPQFTRTDAPRATADDRKRQAEQLAAMGIAIPDEFRKDMAVASEWSTVSATPIYYRPEVTSERIDVKEEDTDSKANVTKRSRPEDGDEVEDMDRISSKRKVWGSTLKAYPGSQAGQAEDLDALLTAPIKQQEPESDIKAEPDLLADGTVLKKEESLDEGAAPLASATTTKVALEGTSAVSDAVDAPVVFKKRKGKR